MLPRCLLAVPALLLLLAGARAAQGNDPTLRILRSATLDRPLLVMSTVTPAPSEAYVHGVRIRVSVEGDFRVYQAFHGGVTRTLHVPADIAPRFAAFDPERDRFEMLSPGLRLELEDYDQLDQLRAAVGGTGGKAYPMLGFAIVWLPPDVNPAEAASALQTLPGVLDVRLMIEGPTRVPR